jgi:hypothetical protein
MMSLVRTTFEGTLVLTGRKPVSDEDSLPTLRIPVDEAREMLAVRLRAGQELLSERPTDDDSVGELSRSFASWDQYNEALLRRMFQSSKIADDYAFQSGPVLAVRTGVKPTVAERVEKLRKAYRYELNFLRNLLDRIELHTPISDSLSPGESSASDAFAGIELIVSRFHVFGRQLQHRSRNRPPLQIKDEYDVQYLLHALLKLFYDDVRTEEWTPSRAGRSSRMDFLLKSERIVVEAKMTRPGLTDGKVGEELIIDVEHYQNHADCDVLVCFVYDPNGLIQNPQGIIRDLQRDQPQLRVRVYISPPA